MKLINLGENNSILNTFIAQMRDKTIQKDSLRFRYNLERVGEVFGYEISKTLSYEVKDVVTPLGIASIPLYKEEVVVATILRAGLPLLKGVMNFYDNAGTAFVAAYRKYDSENEFHVNTEYCTTPALDGKVLIVADTMLATGSSLLLAYERILKDGGNPVHTHFVCPIASLYAVEQMKKKLPANTTLWVAAVDEELTNHSYIVPGLGDAGDLAFGGKLD